MIGLGNDIAYQRLTDVAEQLDAGRAFFFCFSTKVFFVKYVGK